VSFNGTELMLRNYSHVRSECGITVVLHFVSAVC